jgi:LAO/AO transport system kinase
MSLAQRLLAGDRRALARLLTQVENETAEGEAALADIFPHTGRAHIIGITGAPGAGKSTLATALAKALRATGKTIAILAVDPTSPFTGGAILGDRIRMADLTGDPGVFIRSMATRGSLGGLSRASRDAVRLFDAAGYDIVMIETVGAGQSEVEIARIAQTVLVVEAPGMGDDIQAIKAGILEIADVLVVNKADRPGVDATLRALKLMLELGHPALRANIDGHHGRLLAITPQPEAHVNGDGALWIPPVVQTTATTNSGIDVLIDAIDRHRAHLTASGALATLESRQIHTELRERLRELLLRRLLEALPPDALDDAIARIQRRETTPQRAVELLAGEKEQG